MKKVKSRCGVRLAALVAVSSLLPALAACGDKPLPQTAASGVPTAGGSVTAAPEGPSEEEVEKFFTALASDDADQIKSVLYLAAADSVARSYADYLYYRAVASEQAGEDSAPQDLSQVGTGWKACPQTKEQGSCIVWDDVEATGDKISSYTANGEDLAKRLVAGSDRSYRVGGVARAQLLVAYSSVQSKYTFVVLKVKNGQSKSVFSGDVAYLTPKGSQVNAASIEGPNSLLPGSRSTVVLSFPNAPLGGDIYLDMFTAAGQFTQGSAQIPTK